MSVMCRTQPEWRGLVAALGTPGWSKDERYQDSRVVARLYADDLDPYVEAWTRARTREQVFEAGQQHGFPVAPVLTVGEAMSQEQFRHRGFFTQAPGAPLIPGSPFRTRAVPTAGEPRTDPVGTERPLDGLTILDLSWVWSGPMVTAALVDLGARVIKVENRKRADPSRLRGRAFRDGVPVEGPELEVTPYFNQMNRGKHSVEIDMATDEGAELIRRLAKHCDAVVENMRPGVLSKRGLDYAALSAGHPELVMLSLSMLGQTGPLSGIRGYAVVMTGLAGLDSLVGYDEDHLIGSFNPALGDPNGAGHGLAALLAALVKARRTGVGAWIDVSQVEAMVCVLRVPVAQAQTAHPSTPAANRHSVFWPHGVFATSGDDEWIALAARTDAERDRLAGLVGGPKDNQEALTVAVAAWARARSTPEAVAAVAAIDLPVSEVAPYERMRIDPTLEAIHTVEHRWLGAQDTVSVPWERDGVRFRTHRPSPFIGSSTDAVLAEVLGLDADAIAGLRERGVLGPDD
jgi:crotonobetainyl-CoA:carnitine CoA-transferase CaiB-like acyl-CoA transferase